MKTTKRDIARKALALFAERGFDAVSTEDIAQSVGVTKGALYRHYKDKKSILDEILQIATEDDALATEKYNLPISDRDKTDCNLEDLQNFCRDMYRYWTSGFGNDLRKAATLERYKNPTLGKLFDDCFGEGPLCYTEQIFEHLKISDKTMATKLYSTMFFAMFLHDSAPETADEIAQKHFDDFFAAFGKSPIASDSNNKF